MEESDSEELVREILRREDSLVRKRADAKAQKGQESEQERVERQERQERRDRQETQGRQERQVDGEIRPRVSKIQQLADTVRYIADPLALPKAALRDKTSHKKQDNL